MALTQVDIQTSPTFDGQAVTDAQDWAAASGAESGNGVIGGIVVSPSSLMVVAYTAGTALINGIYYTTASGLATVTAASASDRKDIVVFNTGGSCLVVAGTACGTIGWTRNSTGLPPDKPNIPANSIIVAEVYVASTTTTVAAGNLIDKRAITTQGNYVENFATGNVVAAANTPVNLATAVLYSGTWYVVGHAVFAITVGTVGTADFWLGSSSASTSNPYAATTWSTGKLAGGSLQSSPTVTKIISLPVGGTVYFECTSTQVGTALYQSTYKSLLDSTGITAFRIA